ncbi:MAG: hypothetical protein NC131_01075 [Roseburia sp.]|nr:hypothetical protein [Roseburia sp.]
MSWGEFWYGDVRLLEGAQKAYYRNVSYNAWLIGSNVNVALNKYFNNSNAKTRGQINWKWVDFVDPMEKLEKPKITKENMEVEFRKRQAQDKAFLRKLLRKE